MKEIKKAVKKIFFIPNIVYVLLFGFLIRLILGNFGTLRLDQGTFIAWSNILAKGGFANFYNSWSDYLPGYLYILWILGKIQGLVPISQDLLYKLPAIIFDVATGALIYEIVKKIKSAKAAMFASAIYIFNPAVLYNSTFWGQVDSLTAFFVILAIWLVEKNFLLSGVALAVGTLIKPQAAFILPVILFLILRNKWRITKILSYGIVSFFTFVLGFVPFFSGRNLPQFILERLSVSLNQYPYTSVNAFNFWGLFGFWKPDAVIYQTAGYVIVIVIFIFLALKMWKKEKFGYILAAVILSGSFLFFTRMHERHLLPALTPLAIGAGLEPILLIPYIGFSIVYTLNLAYSFSYVVNNFASIYPPMVIKLIILVNISLFGVLIWTVLDREKVKGFISSIIRFFEKGRRKVVFYGLPKIKISPKKVKVLIGMVLVFAFATRVFDLGSPPKEYFDEVYHAFTAKVILHGDSKAWEWWNTPPEGFAYEWTHPPLAKLGMVAGMKIFGENSFGWRIPGALLGALSVLLVYLIAKEIFKDETLALLSGAIFSLDGLGLVMSRIGMNDSYILFFSLLAIYLFLKDKLFFAAISYGLALSSKWSALWVIPIIFVSHIVFTKKLKFSYVWFFVLPPLVYLATYIPMFLTGHGLNIWWGMQEQMWWYHTRLKATHPYTSSWWTWPFLVRPIYLYTSDEIGGWVSRIYAMGNPLVFWFGLVGVAISSVYAFFERNKKLAWVIFSYLVFFTPWALSPRIMFLYHYLPSIPFLAIATGYVLRRYPKLITYYLLLITLVFIYFYPHWAGLSVPLWLDKSYYWFSSWR